MKRFLLATMLSAMLSVGAAAAAEIDYDLRAWTFVPTPVGAEELAQLQSLLPALADDAVAVPAGTIDSAHCSVRVVAGALAYRRDPQQFRNLFFAALVIDDYVPRARGERNVVELNQVAATMSAASTVPGIDDNGISFAAGYCALRDSNAWVLSNKSGWLSVARVVRGMAVAQLLEGTDEDPLAIVDATDKHTAESHGFTY